MDVEGEIRDLKRRVGELEGGFGFLTQQVRAVHLDVLNFQDQTNRRFDKMDGRFDKVEGRLDRSRKVSVWIASRPRARETSATARRVADRSRRRHARGAARAEGLTAAGRLARAAQAWKSPGGDKTEPIRPLPWRDGHLK